MKALSQVKEINLKNEEGRKKTKTTENNGQVWVKPMPETPLGSPTFVAEAQTLRTSSVVFSDSVTGRWILNGIVWTNWCPNQMLALWEAA